MFLSRDSLLALAEPYEAILVGTLTPLFNYTAFMEYISFLRPLLSLDLSYVCGIQVHLVQDSAAKVTDPHSLKSSFYI